MNNHRDNSMRIVDQETSNPLGTYM